MKLTDQQIKAIQPQVERLRQLAAEIERQKAVVLYMAGMVDARVLDATSGVRFNTDTFEIEDPDAAP